MASPPPVPAPVSAQETAAAPAAKKPEQIKNPFLAAIASGILPGLGQIYNGEGYSKGIIFLLGAFIGTLFLFLPGLIIWLYAIYDAYTMANKINTGEAAAGEASVTNITVFIIAAVVIVPVVLVLLTVVLSAVIAAFVFGMVGTTDVQVNPAFTAIRTGDTSVSFTFVDKGGATSLRGLNIMMPSVTDPVLVSPLIELSLGETYTINDPQLSGRAHIVVSSMVDGKKQVVLDTFV